MKPEPEMVKILPFQQTVTVFLGGSGMDKYIGFDIDPVKTAIYNSL